MKERMLKIHELARKQLEKISTIPIIREASMRRIENKYLIKNGKDNITATDLLNKQIEKV